jgi:hypothetical protein
MKQPSFKRHGIRNVTAINWHLPTSPLYEKIVSRGEESPSKKMLLVSRVFTLSV